MDASAPDKASQPVAILSAVVVACNEERNIGDCIRSLEFCDEIVVVDSGSGDRTVEIARGMGAKVYSNHFSDYSSQKNFGIERASGRWVFSVDADERVTEALAREIRGLITASSADGFYVRRKNNLLGRWMRFGDNARDYQLRLIKRELARFEGAVHERMAPPARVRRMNNALLHYSTRTAADYMRKMNFYTGLETRQAGAGSRRPSLWARPLFSFVRLGLLRGGLWDGTEGFIWSIMSAYYEFVRQAKRWESGHGQK